MDAPRLLPPEAYQLFYFEFPRLTRPRRVAALGWKVREAVPLAPHRYQWRTTWILRGSKAAALVAVLKNEDDQTLGPGPWEWGFPLRVSTGVQTLRWHQWVLVYDHGWLSAVRRTGSSEGSSPVPPGGKRFLVGREYRLGPPRAWGLPLGLVGLALWVWVAWAVTSVKEQEASRWERWSLSIPGAAPGPVVADWKTRTGFPTLGLVQAMAQAWGDRYKLLSLSTSGPKVTIEARGPGAVQAVEALRLQRGLERFQLVKTVRASGGQDQFLVVGEVSLDP